MTSTASSSSFCSPPHSATPFTPFTPSIQYPFDPNPKSNSPPTADRSTITRHPRPSYGSIESGKLPLIAAESGSGYQRKLLYLVRHAESEYNNTANRWPWNCCNCCRPPAFPDPKLSKAGIQEARYLRERVLQDGLFADAQLVIASPLTRALQTATIVFEGTHFPLAVSALVTEIQLSECDLGSDRTTLLQQFPDMNFTGFAERWWYTADSKGSAQSAAFDVEPLEHVRSRAQELKDHLLDRREQAIVLIGHQAFFREFVGFSLKIPFGKYVKVLLDEDGQVSTFDKGF